MSPDPLVVARWSADEGDAELVLYDSGALKLYAPSLGIDLEIASPWKPVRTPVTDGNGNGGEHA